MLEKLESNPSVASSVKSRSFFKAKLAVLEMKTYSSALDIKMILADVRKGGRNKSPTDDR